MQWLRENTSEDAVIASWWDYGYWISTLAERKTLADNSTLLDWQIRKMAAMYMSTPEDAWQILMSDTKTDVSSYYVTLPNDIMHATQHSGDLDTNTYKLGEFQHWKECIVDRIINCPESDFLSANPLKGNLGQYDPDIAAKYPTLFDYWESEVYLLPPIITGLDADYIIINLAAEKLPEENIMDLYTLCLLYTSPSPRD